ncbi:hypothetical protein [Jeotgalibacillus malaysiensis]|uniref:hypothetical protein n=1 Tax=Jeotgalibacillus malaysiensis TaxID=1508404 RepID=UPI00384C4F02
MVLRQTRFSKPALAILFFLITTNIMLYQPAIQRKLSISLERGVVLGSMIDLLVVMPLLAFAAFRIEKKHVIGVLLLGLLMVKLLVPASFQEMVTPVFYTGLAFEGLLLAAELSILILVLWKLPIIKESVRQAEAPLLFAAVHAVSKNLGHSFILRVFVHEFLIFYYAIAGFWKKPYSHAGTVTMHKKTSVIAIHLMLIHAIILETIGLHWWLHSKWPILSFVLLLLNVYSILLFLAEMQIARLVPFEIKNGKLYAAQGIRQQLTAEVSNIDYVEWTEVTHKDTPLFAYQDFEKPVPQFTIYFKEPVEMKLFYGKTKMITIASFCVDEPEKVKQLMERYHV